MSTQPEALRLADRLMHGNPTWTRREAATELRRLHEENTALRHAIEQAQKQEPLLWSWVCNECGSSEFTSAVSESDLNYLSCSGCGCDEFHKDTDFPPSRQPEPVIDKSAAIRIATALGWTPPRQPEQEPVAVVSQNSTGQIALMKPNGDAFDVSKHLGQSFYIAPPPRQPLSDELEALFTNIDHAISCGCWNVQKGSQTWEIIAEAKASHGIKE